MKCPVVAPILGVSPQHSIMGTYVRQDMGISRAAVGNPRHRQAPAVAPLAPEGEDALVLCSVARSILTRKRYFAAIRSFKNGWTP